MSANWYMRSSFAASAAAPAARTESRPRKLRKRSS